MADTPFQAHFPDEFDPEISFAPVRDWGTHEQSIGPSLYDSKWLREPNWIYNEAADNDTLYVYDRSNTRTDERDFFFVALPDSQLALLDAFLDATRGRPFRMTHPISKAYLTVQIAPSGYPRERTYQRARVNEEEVDGWTVQMRLRVLS